MSDSKVAGELPPLEPDMRPPIDRFCDAVLDGGVVNGVVYPGFLLELARKFRFHSLGGTSVGAIAASLAAACEYNRRFGSDNGFNEVLAKMPKELSDFVNKEEGITKIRSLFQPHKDVKRAFDWMVDLLGGQISTLNNAANAHNEQIKSDTTLVLSEANNIKRNLWQDIFTKSLKHLGPNFSWLMLWAAGALAATFAIDPSTLVMRLSLTYVMFFVCSLIFHPLLVLLEQIRALIRLDGMGMCTGMRNEDSSNAGLMEWLYEGTQKAAGLQMDRPLTFHDLWQAPAGPASNPSNTEYRSIDLRMISTCLSHGRIYELPLANNDDMLMFRLSELTPFFPVAVIDHLRRVSFKVSFETSTLLQKIFYARSNAVDRQSNLDPMRKAEIFAQLGTQQTKLNKQFQIPESTAKGLNEPDIRCLPVGELPILVAARMSMSCPILFQNLPFLGLNLDRNAEDIAIVRLWFSDGGIGSNFPIHLFDKALPSWPTFGMKILDEPPRTSTRGNLLRSFIPYSHLDGAFDNLMYPRDSGSFTVPGVPSDIRAFVKLLFSIYTSAKDGNDQSYLRMPDVRNRVVKAYMNNRAGNMLNLKIDPKMIIELALDIGARGGKNAAQAYLAEIPDPAYSDWVNVWSDHRWVRLQMTVHGLRSYVQGFTESVRSKGLPGSKHADTLLEQIDQTVHTPPLRSPSQQSDEVPLTQEQADALKLAVKAIENLEEALAQVDLPQPYVPAPSSELRFKPKI